MPTNVSYDMALDLAATSGWERRTGPETNDSTCGPATLKPTVKNLIVRNVKVTEGTVDYFKWDPDAGGALAAPSISFTIEDADPHTYDCVVYYRSTSGSQTWAGNDYWAATKTGCAPGTVTISLAADATSGHLDPEVHEWGTYTFDIVVTEHDGAAQVDRYGYKEPYCLWVPATTPETPPREGHTWWWRFSDEGPPEIRAQYWLNDQGLNDADELSLTAVDPGLEERATIAGPTQAGTMHAGTDGDADGEPDGIVVYQRQADYRPGSWRVLWTGADACGLHLAARRTHDCQRMLVANVRHDPRAWLSGSDDGPLRAEAVYAAAKLYAMRIRGERVFESVHLAPGPPGEADELRAAIQTYDLVFFAGHGICYGNRRTTDADPWYGAPYNWTSAMVTDDNAQGANHHHGDGVVTRHPWPHDPDVLATYTGVAQRLSGTGHWHPYPLFAQDDSWRGGLRGRDCGAYFVFLYGCNTARSDGSLGPVIAQEAPHACTLGFCRKMNDAVASVYTRKFWDEFTQPAHDWRRCDVAFEIAA